MEYLTQDSTLELVGVDFELFKVELSCANFGLKSTYRDSNLKSIAANFGIGVIMIMSLEFELDDS